MTDSDLFLPGEKGFFRTSFPGIDINRKGKIRTPEGIYPPLKPGQKIEIDGKSYYDFEFYEPFKESLTKKFQQQLAPVAPHVHRLQNGYYNDSTKKKTRFVYEGKKYGIDETNNVFDLATGKQLSRYSRVKVDGKDISRSQLVYMIATKRSVKPWEAVITYDPYAQDKRKYSLENLRLVSILSDSILLRDGTYYKVKDFPEIYVNEKGNIFSIRTNHIDYSRDDFYLLFQHRWQSNIKLLRAYLVFQNIDKDIVDRSRFAFVNNNEISISSIGKLYNIETNELDGEPVSYSREEVDESRIKKHPIYNYGVDIEENKIYSFRAKKYINQSNVLSLRHDGNVVKIGLLQFVKECLSETN